ncbi:MAG: phage holin family protein [Bacteroidia bacterium]|nr:phage holin family protein [Bacteroidia bacterium]
MKNRQYLLLGLIAIFLFSCTIEKRLYRPGFYVSGHSNEKQKIQGDNKEEHVPKEILVNSDHIAELNVPQTELCQNLDQEPDQINSRKEHSIKSSFTTRHVLKKNPTFNPKKKVLVKEKNSSHYRDKEDMLILIGFLVAMLGLILMIVGYVLLATNPPFAQALLIVGLALFILGIITAGIGDPSIFLDILIAILEAL